MPFLAIAIFLLATSSVNTQAQTHNAVTKLDSPTASTQQQVRLSHGLTHVYFTEWKGPKILSYVYIPWNVDPQTAPIMFMMHGAKRNAARYLSEWDEFAEKNGFIVIAPEFSRNDYPKSRHYNSGNVFKDSMSTVIPESLWSFSAIEPLFDYVVRSINGQQKNYTLYGHSAGSQFVHRYMMFKPQARVNRYLPANAGWYTFADLNIEYPYGLKGSGVTEKQLMEALQKDVVILLGDSDNDANHSSLRRTKEAINQGPHRFARGKAYYANAKENAKKYGVKFGWKLRIIKDVAHSNGGIAANSSDLVK